MSPNSFDFDRAVNGLKQNQPDRVPTADELLRPTRARRSPWVMRVAVVTTCTAIGVGFLIPRSTAGIAWAQVAETFTKQTKVHTKETSKMAMKDGQKMSMESWVDGNKYYFKTTWGDRHSLAVCDGKRGLSYRDMTPSKNGEPRSAWISRVDKPENPQFSGPMGLNSNSIEETIKAEGITVIKQETIDGPKGKQLQYRLKQEGYGPQDGYTYLVTADAGSGLINRVEFFMNEKSIRVATVEYPEQIDPKIFKVEGRGYVTKDWNQLRDKVSNDIKNGLGTKVVAGKKITVRSVLYSEDGALWVLWTGSTPSGDLKHAMQIVGYPAPVRTKYSFPANNVKMNLFSNKAFTLSANLSTRSKPSPLINERIGGMAVGLMNQTFKEISVIIPVVDETGAKKLGTARFDHLPVRRIESIYSVGDLLGER